MYDATDADRVAVGDPSDDTLGENGTGEEFTGAVYLIDRESGALSETLFGATYRQRFGAGVAALGGGLAVTSASAVDLRSIQIFSPCNDGTVDPPEGCDDGNQLDGDGCSSRCERENAAPDYSAATSSVIELSLPNHKYVDVSVIVPDRDGDVVAVTVTAIAQDEPLNVRTCPDHAALTRATNHNLVAVLSRTRTNNRRATPLLDSTLNNHHPSRCPEHVLSGRTQHCCE